MVSGTIINKIPEGLGLIGILIIDAPVDLLFQYRGRAGSAIIEEEVITIYPVLRPVIDKQGVPYYYHFINFAALTLMLLGWYFIPQHLNSAFIPLVASIWVRSGWGVYRKIWRIG